MKLTLMLALALCACGQTTHKPTPPASACKTEPNGAKIWYPEMSEFSPPGFRDGYRINFDGWPAICANGKWITDEEEVKKEREYRKPLDELVAAASSRLLTVEETKRLLQYGPMIFTRENTTFREADINRQFDNLLFLQNRFMLEAAREQKDAK